MSTFGDSRVVLSIFDKNGCLQKINFLSMRKQQGFDETWGVLGGQVPRLYGATNFGGVQHTWRGPVGP